MDALVFSIAAFASFPDFEECFICIFYCSFHSLQLTPHPGTNAHMSTDFFKKEEKDHMWSQDTFEQLYSWVHW